MKEQKIGSISMKNFLKPAPQVKDVPKLKLLESNEESLRFIKADRDSNS